MTVNTFIQSSITNMMVILEPKNAHHEYVWQAEYPSA